MIEDPGTTANQMTTPIYALVIGVLNDRSNDFHALPAARSDALNFYRMLLPRGFTEENVLHLSEHVTQEQFHQCIEKMVFLTKPFRLDQQNEIPVKH